MLHFTFHICVIIVCLRNSVRLEGLSAQPSVVFNSVEYRSENAHVQLALPYWCLRLVLENQSVWRVFRGYHAGPLPKHMEEFEHFPYEYCAA
jgi:hypothetical protein